MYVYKFPRKHEIIMKINIYLEKKSLEAIKKKELEEKLKIPINI
jgi:hypothetical protein